ncbi:hypothetical protein BD779DRAFT_1501830 [Infundibulicybe gibba]|nr:hypothetical protein BD779DRAFT_1501830 [Infundibulicybe gibba]
MEYPPLFMRLRAVAFCSISLTSFVWIIILCVDIFSQWDLIDRSERSIIVVMLLGHTITLIALLILLLLPFRWWLDATRVALLLIIHIGTASSFAYSNAKFQCPNKNADQEGLCKLLNMYILIASWIVPVLLLNYSFGLALMIYRRPREENKDAIEPIKLDDEEFDIGRHSLGPQIVSPGDFPVSPSPHRISTRPSERATSTSEKPVDLVLSESPRESIFTTRASARLSKPLPAMYY